MAKGKADIRGEVEALVRKHMARHLMSDIRKSGTHEKLDAEAVTGILDRAMAELAPHTEAVSDITARAMAELDSIIKPSEGGSRAGSRQVRIMF